MISVFEGFSEETTEFLWGIAFHNERSWFLAHKAQYQRAVQIPLHALAEETAAEFFPLCPDLTLLCHVSRIYRDARRLHGRGPYKEHLWFTFHEPGGEHWSTGPAFYFELGPNLYQYGMGYYQAPASTMAKFRARMDRDPKPAAKLIRAFARQDTFTQEGICYKKERPAPAPLFKDWYNRRNLDFCCRRDPDERLYSAGVKEDLVRGFRFLLPYYRYLVSVERDPDPREP